MSTDPEPTNIFATMLQDLAEQDLPIIETQTSDESDNSSIYDDLFTTIWDDYDDEDDTIPQMFLIEPHVEHPPDDEPEMVDPKPVPVEVEPKPQHRTQFTPKMT